jgi:tRNA (cytidine/uridine-2'-O-)-methyltransferase
LAIRAPCRGQAASDEGRCARGGPGLTRRAAHRHGATLSAPRPPLFHVALLHPEIGPNAGNAGRLCLGLGARLHLVHPLGFSTDDKAVRRAGLDYWSQVDVVEHPSADAFFAWAAGRRLFLYSTHARRPYTTARHEPGDVLLFGCESVGLPPELVARHGGWQMPLVGPIRSLNLSNAVAIAAYHALQQLRPELFSAPSSPSEAP